MNLILQAIKKILRRIEGRIDRLVGSVESAQATADTAVANAKTAQTTASNAASQATSAQRIAEEAKTLAEKGGDCLPLAGGTMSGSIAMNGNRITGLAAPTNLTDAVTKNYVDQKRRVFTATLEVSRWSGTGPFTQKMLISGARKTDRPHVGLCYSGDVTADIAMQKEATKISYAKAEDGGIVFTCLTEKPTVDISIMMEVLT